MHTVNIHEAKTHLTRPDVTRRLRIELGVWNWGKSLAIVAACVIALTASFVAGQPVPQPPSPNERSNAGAGAPAPTAQGAQVPSDRCYTPAANCILSDAKRKGSDCWCATPFGPSYGRVK
jgi:hypothetical protein